MSTSLVSAADTPKAAETDSQAETIANTTGVTSKALQKTLEDKLAAQHVDIEDMSGTTSLTSLRYNAKNDPIIGGCGQMFQAMIVSPQFDKKNTLARHRLVNSALKEEIAAIHAWTPKCFTPEEWEKRRTS